MVRAPLREVMHHAVTEVIPEIEGVQAFSPAYFNTNTTKGSDSMNCPKCGKHATIKNVISKYTTAIGLTTGGYLSIHGTRLGAQLGSMFFPGFGTIAGGLLGFLTGAAAGGLAGASTGRLVDENIARYYICDFCGHEWRAA